MADRRTIPIRTSARNAPPITPSQTDLNTFRGGHVQTAIDMIARNRALPSGTRETLTQISRASDALARRGGVPFSVSVDIDLHKLSAALNDVADHHIRDKAVYRALNDAIDKANTLLKRDLQKWTGIKIQARIAQAMRKKYARPNHWSAAIIIKDKHIAITAEYFGARWNRSMPGVAHSAWGRAQIAKGAFMIPGKKPAFHRVGPSRLPIKPVWGPNTAREAERHADEVRATLRFVVETVLKPRLAHNLQRAFVEAKARRGL
jgi:hypothetical protein